ncbi:MAG: hypothetical protein ACREQR_01665 [Candidatus Binataceae bacterium]
MRGQEIIIARAGHPVARLSPLNADLPALHKDPFDRMLLGQAQIEDLRALTADREISRYLVKVVW